MCETGPQFQVSQQLSPFHFQTSYIYIYINWSSVSLFQTGISSSNYCRRLMPPKTWRFSSCSAWKLENGMEKLLWWGVSSDSSDCKKHLQREVRGLIPGQDLIF